MKISLSFTRFLLVGALVVLGFHLQTSTVHAQALCQFDSDCDVNQPGPVCVKPAGTGSTGNGRCCATGQVAVQQGGNIVCQNSGAGPTTPAAGTYGASCSATSPCQSGLSCETRGSAGLCCASGEVVERSEAGVLSCELATENEVCGGAFYVDVLSAKQHVCPATCPMEHDPTKPNWYVCKNPLPPTNPADETQPGLNAIDSTLTQETLNNVNPLLLFGDPSQTGDLSTPGAIISRLLTFLFPLAGLILFVMLVWGGFEILAGATTKKSLDAGKNRITAAIIGFVLLFISYWVVQIIDLVFGTRIF